MARTLARKIKCEGCHGRGTCRMCGGAGRRAGELCRWCKGGGKCHPCRGKGKV